MTNSTETNYRGRPKTTFNDIDKLRVLQAARDGTDFPFSAPLIKRFYQETGLLIRKSNDRVEGTLGRLGSHYYPSQAGWVILNLRYKSIEKAEKAKRIAEAMELEEKAAELRAEADAITAKATALRNEAEKVSEPKAVQNPVENVQVEIEAPEAPVEQVESAEATDHQAAA